MGAPRADLSHSHTVYVKEEIQIQTQIMTYRRNRYKVQ